MAPVRGGLWRRGSFVRFWGANALWATSAEVVELALPSLAILSLGASPTQAALLVSAPWLAFLAIGLPAGAVVDRISRKQVIVVAGVGRIAALASVPVAFGAGRLGLPWLYAVAALNAVLAVFSQVALRSLLPALVARDELLAGNAKLTLDEGAAKAAGPALTGMLIQLVGAVSALLTSAVVSLCSVFMIAGLPRDGPGTRPTPTEGLVADAREGLAFVLGQPVLRRIIAVNALGNLGTGIVEGVALVFAYRQLRLDPAAVGLAMAVGSAGFFVTAAFSHRLTRRLGVGPTLAYSSFVYAVAPFALLAGLAGHAFAAVVLWRLLYGVSLPPYDVNATTIRQAVTPARLQGRAIAAINTIGYGALGIGPVLGGVFGEHFALQTMILLGGVACLLGVIPTFVPRLLALDDTPVANPGPAFAAD